MDNPPNLTCTLCDKPMVWKTIHFIEGHYQWSIEIPVCISPNCLIQRGASKVEHRFVSKPRAY